MKKILLPIIAFLSAVFICSAVTRSKKSEISRNLETFASLYSELQTYYVDSIDASKSITTAINAMLDEIDPYTEYIPEKEQESFRAMTTGEYGGIGALIMYRDGGTYIENPYEGSPSSDVGMRPGDHILMIDNDTVATWKTDKVSDKLRGPAGTKLKVTVARPYVDDSILTFDITRRKIQMPAVPYYGIVGDNTGYINLNSFTDKSYDEVKKALQDLIKTRGAKSIILDLRGNGGGLMESAIQILGLFLPKNTHVLTTKGKDAAEEQVYKTPVTPVDTKIPLAVLIDGGSASSSEIVAGALQDLDRAVILGERSYGKGLVQSTRPLPNQGMLKVTIAKYYIPSGRLIQAIDYSHRNASGEATRIPDSLTTEYKTIGGRTVRDGGGITPDVTVKTKDATRLALYAVSGQWIFDYANQYRVLHDSILPPGEFEITDEIYADFKKSINPEKFKYDRVCETMLDNLKKQAEIEGYMNDSVKMQFTLLSSMLHHDLDKDLDNNRELLSPFLASEIMSRYYHDSGALKNHLRHDEVVGKAIEIINSGGITPILKGK